MTRHFPPSVRLPRTSPKETPEETPPKETPRFRYLIVLLVYALLLAPIEVFAHPGHGDHEFEGGGTAGTAEAVQVDPTTSDRMGIRVEPIGRESLSLGIKATGQIEALPNQQVRVTAPLTGTVVRLLVQPGDRVQQGQALAVLTSPDLAGLRTEALDRQTEAQGAIQTAEADLRLAQRNYDRQVQMANAAIGKAETEYKLAQERYSRDKELAAQGAIASRTVLESEAQLAAARAELTEARSRMGVSEAAAQLERAKSAVQVARSHLQLSDDSYQTRLRQLNIRPSADSLVTVIAPIAGTIADQTITPGESVNEAGVPLMTIVNGNGIGESCSRRSSRWLVWKDAFSRRWGLPIWSWCWCPAWNRCWSLRRFVPFCCRGLPAASVDLFHTAWMKCCRGCEARSPLRSLVLTWMNCDRSGSRSKPR